MDQWSYCVTNHPDLQGHQVEGHVAVPYDRKHYTLNYPFWISEFYLFPEELLHNNLYNGGFWRPCDLLRTDYKHFCCTNEDSLVAFPALFFYLFKWQWTLNGLRSKVFRWEEADLVSARGHYTHLQNHFTVGTLQKRPENLFVWTWDFA